MTNKKTPEEERLIKKVSDELKKLVRKYGYEYCIIAMNRYIKKTKEKKKLLKELEEYKKRIKEIEEKL